MHFIYSIVAYVAFSSCLRREDQFVVVVYFPRGARRLAVVMVNDPFSDLFFGSEKSVLSEITNPFLDSPKKTHPEKSCCRFSLP